ncbi:MAG: thioredoxin domain-containing protein [Phycisphaerales bacterium]
MLLVCIAASSGLALAHFDAAHLPGCGFDGGCARAAASAWGSVPWLRWPTSFVGVAYFAGLLAAWIMARGALPVLLRGVVIASAVGSIGLLVVMATSDLRCAYCAVVHVANLGFVPLALLPRREAPGLRRPVVAFSLVAVVATLGLGIAESVRRSAQAEREEAALQASISTSIAAARATGAAAGAPEDAGTPRAPREANVLAAEGKSELGPETSIVASEFTGRYRRGPSPAPIRIVVFSDYQCQDCRRVDAELGHLLEERDDVSVSHKHFPLCADCNAGARAAKFNPHPNACWAARAAEAAGQLGGADGFWRMHEWLFRNRGAFTSEQLTAGVAELGFDPIAFTRRMQSPETFATVERDVAEGASLGVRQTPTVYLNGVEIAGWQRPDAIRRAVSALAATSPPWATAASDRPADALEKFMNEWRAQPRRSLPDLPARAMGASAETAATEVVVWGDLVEPTTGELDKRMRAIVAARGDVRYVFRHFPMDESCNPAVERTLHPAACLAARAAEAAGTIGGDEAFWRMQAALLAHGGVVDDGVVTAAAAAQGLDADAFAEAIESADVVERIRADAESAKALGLKAIPMLFVAGRRVPNWRVDGVPVVELIVGEACAGGR